MPIVSFIITYYCEPLPLLAECLRSVLQVRSLMMQREMARQDFEIVVVDDGSQLSPLRMLKQMDEDICYIRQTNAGLSAARNAGLAAAHGEYVQFVDADDALLPHAYCSLCPQSREEADIILFRFTDEEHRWHEDETGTLTGNPTSPADEAGCHRAMSGTQYMLHHNVRASACCYLFRRSLLGELRFANGMLHEDELFTPLLLLRMHSVRDYTWRAYYYRHASPHHHPHRHSLPHSPQAQRYRDHPAPLARCGKPPAGGRQTCTHAPSGAVDHRLYIYNVESGSRQTGAREAHEAVDRRRSPALAIAPLHPSPLGILPRPSPSARAA